MYPRWLYNNALDPDDHVQRISVMRGRKQHQPGGSFRYYISSIHGIGGSRFDGHDDTSIAGEDYLKREPCCSVIRTG
jgi:hypothetical protein